MFSKESNDAVSFTSNWKTEQSLADGSSQTEETGQVEKSCQVLESAEISVQTEEEEPIVLSNPDYNVDSLAAFLKRIGPQVIQELERQNRSRAFEGFSLVEKEESSGVKLLHALRWNQLQSDDVVSCIDWSCTGSVIGVSYGAKYHEDWCDHKGFITIWNINRSDFDTNQPERVIEVTSCVLCLAFHPNNPAVFVAGTFSGELLVFDLSHSEDTSPIATGECGSSITSLSWITTSVAGESTFSKSPNSIVTSTTNGFILVWGLNLTKQILPLKSGFMLQSQDVPRGLRTRIGDSVGVEVTTASFNYEDSALFVIGAEGGGLFLCSTASEIPAGKEYGDIRLMRCVTSVLGPHTGRVLTSQFSQHHRNAILSSASDNQIRLYSLLQPNKPVSVIYSEESITCSQLSPSRPMVVATGLVTGQVALYDFGLKSGQPFLMLPAAEKPSAITTLKFNRKNMALLGVGDQLGRVSIWQLPDSAVSPLSTELSSLSTLLDTVAE